MYLKENISIPFFVLIIFSLVFISCGNNKSKLQSVQKMEFNIDSSLLGNLVINQKEGVSFSPPVNWKTASDKEVETAASAINKAIEKEKNISVTPLNIFVDKKSNSILNVASIKIAGDGKSFDSKVKEYQNIFMRNSDSSKVKKAVYMKDNIKIVQYLIQGKNMVNFRLLFENGNKNLIQFDYLTDLKDYSNEIKAIESSIGSIKLI